MAILSYADAVARYPELADHPEVLIQSLLDAAEELLLDVLGPGAGTYDDPDAVNELITVRGGDLLMLGRPASEILTVIEDGTTLAADDYELRSSGTTLRRLDSGTNSRLRWWGRIDITYVPQSDAARREVAQVAIVRLLLDYKPGVVSERIGEWSETFAQGNVQYRDELNAILSTLRPAAVGIW